MATASSPFCRRVPSHNNGCSASETLPFSPTCTATNRTQSTDKNGYALTYVMKKINVKKPNFTQISNTFICPKAEMH